MRIPSIPVPPSARTHTGHPQTYKSGELLSGEIKKRCIEVIQPFVAEFQKVRWGRPRTGASNVGAGLTRPSRACVHGGGRPSVTPVAARDGHRRRRKSVHVRSSDALQCVKKKGGRGLCTIALKSSPDPHRPPAPAAPKRNEGCCGYCCCCCCCCKMKGVAVAALARAAATALPSRAKPVGSKCRQIDRARS